MKEIFLRRIVVSFFTSIIFAIIASLIFMNSSYGFDFYFIAFLIYCAPAIFLIGLPYSLLIEALLAQINFKNIYLYISTLIVLYAGGGFIGTWLYFFALAKSESEPFVFKEVLPYTIFGISAALVFLVSMHSLEILLRKFKLTK